MFYIASKVLWLVAQPSSLCAIALGLGLLLIASNRRRLGLWLAGLGFAVLVIAGFLPVGNFLVLPLEERFAGQSLPEPGADVAGIIILGGFEDGWVSAGRGGLAVNESAERLTEGVRLAKRWPQARVVFTGGVAGLLSGGTSGAGPVGAFLKDVGIEESRIVLEAEARNTWQNAVNVRELVKPSPQETWVLVTSAYHMPRSVGVFRKAGFDVVAAPVDFRTRDAGDLMRLFETIPAGLQRFDLGAREWIGLFAYWLSGRTSALLPLPDAP